MNISFVDENDEVRYYSPLSTQFRSYRAQGAKTAQFPQRVGVDVLECPKCFGRIQLIASLASELQQGGTMLETHINGRVSLVA